MLKPREWPLDAPLMTSPKVTLFVVIDGVPMYGRKVGDKQTLIEQTEGMPLWGTWRGEHGSTDVFGPLDRGQAELEVCARGDRARGVDPGTEAMLVWFAEEKGRQGLADTHVSRAAAEVSGARWLLGKVSKAKIAAVAQWALRDQRRPFGWRGNLKTIAGVREHWDQLMGEWERADSPPYDPDLVWEEDE